MAEREGFEPPIPVKVCLISSQVHSTGLCHLSGRWPSLEEAVLKRKNDAPTTILPATQKHRPLLV